MTLLEEIERRNGKPPLYGVLTLLGAHSKLVEQPVFQALLWHFRAQLEEVFEVLVEAEREGTLPAYLEELLSHAIREFEAANLTD